MKTRYRYTQTVIIGGAFTGRRAIKVQHDYPGAGPMGFSTRIGVYNRQSGDLTNRQLRQLDRMAWRAQHRTAG